MQKDFDEWNKKKIKNLDSGRLAKKICTIDPKLLKDIKKKASRVNFD